MDLSNRLRLSFDQLEILRGKVKSFENYYQVQKDVKASGIFFKQIQLCDDNFDELCLEKLSLEFERLREIMRAIIYKAIEELTKYIELLLQEVSRLQELYVCLN
ncbi:hypothetical protein Glove_13g243 [Diversispora epigaea]|uniref:Uncharacterized protein n=1 Tax=Diversispora epigaea TaxID=1348612 RepID=A0A397JRH7_9GLOM|nr:hypothetical protein Glove_13g243 [Diversispora epigaea]